MTQVITNLLNNAAKYTDNEGQIEISLENHDSQCAIAIRDTGTGIAPDMLSSVFDLFTQAERTLDRSSGGLGIGLTLVRKLVEMHQGTVVAESDGLGQGSCFTVHLPTCSPHEVDSRLRSDGALPSQAHRELEILVVDDNVDAAETLATLLRQSGHQVQVAYDGFSGMTIASAFRPNLVFLDIGLPGLNGYEVARQLRQLEATQHAILIATSGYGQPQDESRSQQAGFDMHLVKPVKFNLLQDVLRSQRFPAIKQ